MTPRQLYLITIATRIAVIQDEITAASMADRATWVAFYRTHRQKIIDLAALAKQEGLIKP